MWAPMPLARVAFDEQALVNQVAQCENSMGSSQVVWQPLGGRGIKLLETLSLI